MHEGTAFHAGSRRQQRYGVSACAFVADNFNGGAPSSTHSGGYISWPPLDLPIFMISKALSQAISGNPDGFGMKLDGSNTAFSYGGGFH